MPPTPQNHPNDPKLPSPATETAESSQFTNTGSPTGTVRTGTVPTGTTGMTSGRTPSGGSPSGQPGDKAARAAEDVKGKASDAARDATQVAKDAGKQATDAAKQSYQDAKVAASDAYEQGKHKASDLGQQALSQTKQAAGQLRQQAAALVNGQTDRAADEVDTFAKAIRRSVDTLREEGDDRVAEYAEGAAVGVENVRDYLRRADADGLYRDAGDFVRRRPEWAMGGLFVAGIALGRFLKASREDRMNDRADRPRADYVGRDIGGRGYAGSTYSPPSYGTSYGGPSDMDRSDRLADADRYGDRRAPVGLTTPSPSTTVPAPAYPGSGNATVGAGTAGTRIPDDLGSTGKTATEKREIAKGTADAVNPAATPGTSGSATTGLKGEVH